MLPASSALDLNGYGPEARKLVLEGQENIHADDVEAFQKNLEELPDEASLEDYEKVPVEEFGAALLRGMGWNGDAKGSEAYVVFLVCTTFKHCLCGVI